MNTEKLIERTKAGDRAALRTLYEAYSPMMRNICRNIANEDEDMVNDIVQTAFVRAYYSLGQLRDASKFGEWVASITKRTALKHLARKQNAPFVPFSNIMEEELENCGTISSDALLAEKDILELIDQLPKGYGQVFRMSVIEGYSHQEIADKLGIEPHSSSSQLSRAKAMLRKVISRRGMGFIVLVLACIPVGIYLFSSKDKAEGGMQTAGIADKRKDTVKQKGMRKRPDVVNTVPANHVAAMCKDQHQTPHAAIDSIYHDSASISTDTIFRKLIAAEAHDSIMQDTLRQPLAEELNLADYGHNGKKRRWQLLAAGSLGSALAQNAYRTFAGSSGADIDGPQPSGPETFTTWEEYYRYLLQNAHDNMSEEEKVLMEIALNNKNNTVNNINNDGKIVEHEHHYKPITFGLSVAKPFRSKWSMETGLQYSLLKSDFTLGEDAYRIKRSQNIHYIGIPLQMSYRWVDGKNLSAYSSLGTTLHIPVYGKNTRQYVTGQTVRFHTDSHFTPALQWCVGTSIGMQYQFAPKWGVYIEPSLYWYVPNGSSIHTTWTEHPFTFTIPFGIRFTW